MNPISERVEQIAETFFDMLIICFFLTIGNYLYQLVSGQMLWDVALERAYFQVTGGLTVYIFFPRTVRDVWN